MLQLLKNFENVSFEVTAMQNYQKVFSFEVIIIFATQDEKFMLQFREKS